MSKQPAKNRAEIKASVEAPAPTAEAIATAPIETPEAAKERIESFEKWRAAELASIKFKVIFDQPRKMWRLTGALGVLSAIEYLKDRPGEEAFQAMRGALMDRRLKTREHELRRALRRQLDAEKKAASEKAL